MVQDFHEHAFECPCCGENISMLLDLSVERQEYVEDCEVCCRPLVLRFSTDGEEIQEFTVQPESD